MKISTKGRYALRVMIDLAVNDKGDYVSLKDISNRQEVSLKYLEQIMAMLNKAGYVKSTRGNNGGYRLAKSPEEYKVGDILRKTEGDLAPIASDNGEDCGNRENCNTFKICQRLDNVINEYVDSKTLADLIK